MMRTFVCSHLLDIRMTVRDHDKHYMMVGRRRTFDSDQLMW